MTVASPPRAPRTDADPSLRSAGATGSRRARTPTAPSVAGILVGASLVAATCIAAHAMWFDEIQAWNIARASHSVGGLITNLRCEGHPVLWYLPLFALSRFTRDPVAMQVFEWVVLTATFAVVLARAPFAIGVRGALIFGYLVFFEYGVMSRAYGLGVLLLLSGIMWMARPRPRWVCATVAFMLLGWTSLAGGVLAIAVAAAVASGVIAASRSERSLADGRLRLGFAATTIVSALVAGVTCIPPSDFVSFSLGIPSRPLGSLSPARFVAAATGPWRGFAPVPEHLGGWNTNLLDGLPHAIGIQASLSLVLVALVGVALRGHALAFRVWCCGALGTYAFSVAVVLPDRSHYAGMWLLLLVACAWLAAAEAPSDRGPARVRMTAIFLVVVAAQLLATAAIVPSVTLHPFSPHEELARIVTAHRLGHYLVSAQDYDATAIAGYLGTRVRSLARDESIIYFTSDRREERGNARLTQETAVCRAAALAAARRHDVALVIGSDVPLRSGVRLLARTDPVRLYRVSAAAVARCA